MATKELETKIWDVHKPESWPDWGNTENMRDKTSYDTWVNYIFTKNGEISSDGQILSFCPPPEKKKKKLQWWKKRNISQNIVGALETP